MAGNGMTELRDKLPAWSASLLGEGSDAAVVCSPHKDTCQLYCISCKVLLPPPFARRDF